VDPLGDEGLNAGEWYVIQNWLIHCVIETMFDPSLLVRFARELRALLEVTAGLFSFPHTLACSAFPLPFSFGIQIGFMK
jgi:hypothetical protein